MGVVNDVMGAVGSVPGAIMGGIGGGIAKDAPQNNYRAGDQQQIDLEKQKAAAFYSGLPGQLNDMSMGKGPSAADAYMFNANQQATNQANALAQSARGGVSPAMALRMAQNASANAAATNAGTYSTMKNQEAINAINQRANMSQFYDQLAQNGTLGYQGINAGITQNNTNAAANFGGQGMATLGSIGGALIGSGKGGDKKAPGTATAGEPGGVGNLASTALMFAAHGGVIGGHAPHAGDSSENDIVPTMLSPGEAVIPRTAMHDRHKAHAFLDAMLDHAKGAGDAFDQLIHAHHAAKMCRGGMVGAY